MASYRLYLLNDDGHIVDAVEFELEDDRAAEAEANRHLGGRPAELWNQKRPVRTFPGRTHADG